MIEACCRIRDLPSSVFSTSFPFLFTTAYTLALGVQPSLCVHPTPPITGLLALLILYRYSPVIVCPDLKCAARTLEPKLIFLPGNSASASIIIFVIFDIFIFLSFFVLFL
jgi:hypothetical protein